MTQQIYQNFFLGIDHEGAGMGSGPRVPFQRAMSVDSKPFSGARGTGRRSAPSSLIKQESLDSHIGMGEEKYSTLIEGCLSFNKI